MPFDRRKYPADWEQIRARILKRAGNGCECRGECGDAHPFSVLLCGRVYDIPRCHAPNGVRIVRHDEKPELWRTSDDVIDALHNHGEQAIAGYQLRDPIKVVLTLAHLDRDPSSSDETRIRAFCQRCHIKYDAKQHAHNAANTRRSKRAVGDLPGT